MCELMDDSKADELVSQSLLHEVNTKCQLHQLELPSHSCLRKCVDNLSILSGRNPIVSKCKLCFKQMILLLSQFHHPIGYS